MVALAYAIMLALNVGSSAVSAPRFVYNEHLSSICVEGVLGRDQPAAGRCVARRYARSRADLPDPRATEMATAWA